MNPIVTGIGISSAIGIGAEHFWSALEQGKHHFDYMQRPGRQRGHTHFIGAEIEAIELPSHVPARIKRTASWSAQVALTTAHEAWHDANLSRIPPERVGLIVGGSNVQQRELFNHYDKYADRLEFLRPSYAVGFMDTDICGLCTEHLGIKGASFTLGGASASGQLAFIQACQAVQSGALDACIAVGALMDLSFMECQAFTSLGAMGSQRYADQPTLACRPFDQNRDGFIYGEACAALVVERGNAPSPSKTYATVPGWSVVMDQHQGPDPSLTGEVDAITQALHMAQWSSHQVDYINPHGSGSVVGDEVELEAIRQCALSHARINATKALTGHALSAAGAVELVASLLQMQAQRLHPNRNLDQPIASDMAWVGARSEAATIHRTLNISLGFGGLNTAVCLSNPNQQR